MLAVSFPPWTLSVLAGAARALPPAADDRVARAAAGVARRLRPERERAARENLSRLFPELPPPAVAALARAAGTAYARFVIEYLRALDGDPERLAERVRLRVDPAVTEAVAAGRGLVVCTAHIGNWEMGALVLPRFGRDATVVARPQFLPGWRAGVRAAKLRAGLRVAAPEEPAIALCRTLARGGVVALLVDGAGFARGRAARLAGRDVLLPGGPAGLAARTGAVLAGALCRRVGPGRFAVEIEGLAGTATAAGRDEAALHAAVAAWLERAVRAHPGEWCVFRPFFAAADPAPAAAVGPAAGAAAAGPPADAGVPGPPRPAAARRARAGGGGMKIAIVSQSYYPRFGGVSEHVGHSAAALARRGHDVTVVTGRPLHVGHSPAHADPALPGLERVRVVRLGTALLVPFQGAFVDLVVSASLDAELDELWRRERFDLVHVHQPLTPSLPLLATWRRPAPLVGTFHAAGGRSRLFRTFRGPLAWHYGRLDLRLAVSPAAQRFVTGDFAPPPLIVPNGVDAQRFHPAVAPAPGGRDGRFTVLFVGRLDPRKGLGVLLAAWPRVVRELAGEARLNVVGSSALAPLVRAAVPRELRRSVHFAGAVSARDLPGWYAASDVFCSPATRNESFGIVLLEAMASGKAVVCSDLPGYRAVCRPRVEGLLAPPGDPEGLAAALTAVARDAELSRRLGHAGRQRAEAFDWARVAGALESLYGDVLAGREPRPPAGLPALATDWFAPAAGRPAGAPARGA